MKKLLTLIVLLCFSLSVKAELRCGWLVNPTPANWWLNDKDGTWIISAQGGYTLDDESWNNMPEIQDEGYIKTNGNYGYCCACLNVSVDKKNKKILKVKGGKQIDLKRCQQDKNLSKVTE
jgi:hypothetical protein